MGFHDWYKSRYAVGDIQEMTRMGIAEMAWEAASPSERQRIIGIIKNITNDFGNCDRLIEAIDDAPPNGN